MKIGPFEILESLGGGGSGTVYKARHGVLDRVVAIKQLNREVREGDQSFERFRREAQLMASIRSDHVVTLYSFDVIDGRPVLEMECLERGSLERLMSDGPLPVPEAAQIVEDILRGLQALHTAGIVHRDIKPANVLQDEVGRFKLSDFGLSILESDARPTLEAATIRYVAPECIADDPVCDSRSDLYSVGMVLYEAILGADGFRDAFPELTPAAAFGAKWLGWLRDATRDATPLHVLRPEIPSAIAQFAARLMAKDREMRFASADTALEALAAIVDRTPRRVWVGGDARAPEPPRRLVAGPSVRTRHLAIAGGVVLCLAAGAGVLVVMRHGPRPTVGKQALPRASAPADTSRLLVRVVDGEGVGIHDVQLRLVPGNREGRSSTDGLFTFDALRSGSYELTASAVGRVVDVRRVAVEGHGDVEATVALKAAPGPVEGPADPLTSALETAVGPTELTAAMPAVQATPKGAAAPVVSRGPSPAAAPGVSMEPAPAAGIAVVALSNTELSRALTARLRSLLAGRRGLGPGSVRVSLEMTTRPSPFTGRGITADYVATLDFGTGGRSFPGQVLGFSELTLRNDVIDKVAAEIAASLPARP